ncbi:hypothetical protein [Neorickettsia sp. 179522]|uniref:hypothetical protein n=1 Tax=Neorickettsia sp. 179522 TaxID=1714371 RepID=UPI00079CC3BC|nr:hypothetical protein [Neorickettsia sp. 179522]KYH12624.1 hypothetical protein AS219_02425 [Neorickettsia sp. 179522]
MLDHKFKNLVETLIQTDICALDTILELNLPLKEQQAKLKSMALQLQEAENLFNREFSAEIGTANDPERDIQSAISSLLETFQVIVSFAKPNKTGDPLLPQKYRENITTQLKEAHEKSLNALSRLHLYNEIPTHEKTAEYIHSAFQDSTRFVTDILEEPNREKQKALYKQHEQNARNSLVSPFLAITAPNTYRRARTNALTAENSELESEDLKNLIEDTIESETANIEEVVQILGEHAERHGKEGRSTKELGKNVVKSIAQIEDLIRTAVVQHIAVLLGIGPIFSGPIFSVEPVKRKQKSEHKPKWLSNFVRKQITQLKEITFTAKKFIFPRGKLAKKEDLFYVESKKQFLYEEPTNTTSEGKNILKEKVTPPLTALERNPSIKETTIAASRNSVVSQNQETSFSGILNGAPMQSTNNVAQQQDAASTQTEDKKDASTQTENKRDASTQTENKRDASTQTENKKDALMEVGHDMVAFSIQEGVETVQNQK